MKIMNYILVCILSLFSFSCDKNASDAPVVEEIPSFTLNASGTTVTLNWSSSNTASLDLWRSINNGEFEKIASGVKTTPYTDQIEKVQDNDLITYRITGQGGYPHSYEAKRDQQTVKLMLMTDDQLLDKVQSTTLKYFYDFAHPTCKLARERSNIPADLDVVTTGGTGFGIMALIAGAERQYITRQQAYEYIRTMTDFLTTADRFHGAYAHWYYGSTGKVKPFSPKDNGGDLVETAFLMQGLLTAKAYFNTPSSSDTEKKLAADIDQIWRGVEWNYYTQGQKKLFWHWSKEYGFEINMGISGWNEGLIVYVLAASSPTYPIDKETYTNGYCNNGGIKNGRSYYGITLPLGNDSEKGGPLFFTHYSFLGLDPRNLKDDFCDNYFEQNKNHVLINRAYCIENPKKHQGYSENFWGLTASDCPVVGYLAHAPGNNDNGTISPTAALSSIPYAPNECMQVLKYFYRELGSQLFGPYGFYDSINLGVSAEKQVYKSYLAIDQGPIVVMMENYRSNLLWNTFMRNEEILSGLRKLGFTSPHIK